MIDSILEGMQLRGSVHGFIVILCAYSEGERERGGGEGDRKERGGVGRREDTNYREMRKKY